MNVTLPSSESLKCTLWSFFHLVFPLGWDFYTCVFSVLSLVRSESWLSFPILNVVKFIDCLHFLPLSLQADIFFFWDNVFLLDLRDTFFCSGHFKNCFPISRDVTTIFFFSAITKSTVMTQFHLYREKAAGYSM